KVRRSCPDGVFWLTFGQDVPASHGVMSLARLLELETVVVTDAEKANSRLAGALEARRSLIVADDVWNLDAIEPIANAIGPRCRLLVTSRDAGIATSLGAIEQHLKELPEGLSLKMLASWTAMSASELPDSASSLAKRCGYLPLALALCGAMIRDGVPWRDL